MLICFTIVFVTFNMLIPKSFPFVGASLKSFFGYGVKP